MSKSIMDMPVEEWEKEDEEKYRGVVCDECGEGHFGFRMSVPKVKTLGDMLKRAMMFNTKVICLNCGATIFVNINDMKKQKPPEDDDED